MVDHSVFHIQGGQTQTQGGQRQKFFGASRRILLFLQSAHPTAKPDIEYFVDAILQYRWKLGSSLEPVH